MTILAAAGASFDATMPVVVVGGGACGMVAALAAREAGAEVAVIERDTVPRGSTALSSGLVPACGTSFQRRRGIADSPAAMAEDIQRKAKNRNDPAIVAAVCAASGPTIDWLADRHAIPFALVEGFLYPGHRVWRMHGPPARTGAQLMDALSAAVANAGVDVVTDAHVTTLVADAEGRVAGLAYRRPDGSEERVGCGALVLACSGFGGNPAMVREYIPEMAGARYFGHAGNQGDAVAWGTALGAAVGHMGAYQGHGSVAVPQEALITWAIMMEGGFQVNAAGRRFSDEHGGYSEQAVHVLAQPGGIAWNIFDERLRHLAMGFEDFRQAAEAGAVREAASIEALAAACCLPTDALAATVAHTQRLAAGEGSDAFGRDFTGKPALAPPFCAVKVTGALFHTQGGLVVDADARVRRPDGSSLPNLFAGGGAACGLSGEDVAGYLSGNGLLSAVVLGRFAGEGAARLAGG
ncbi:MAG: FAD-dependent oxidoreductase [Alphaproteobacteria bacterium]|nr:FAD-dependent oxidoreductase [Alphaproteobacteria bacterium]